jgi:hypothetical protein
MRRLLFASMILAALWGGCTTLPRYRAPFLDVDQNHDGVVEWREFATYFPDADPKAFLEADRNKDGQITPEEWEFYGETQAR